MNSETQTKLLWAITSLLRWIAPFLYAKWGFTLTEQQWGDIAAWLGAGVILSVSLWTSIKGREKLLNTPPPVK